MNRNQSKSRSPARRKSAVERIEEHLGRYNPLDDPIRLQLARFLVFGEAALADKFSVAGAVPESEGEAESV